MKFILNSVPDKIKHMHDDLGSVQSPKFDGMSRTPDPDSREHQLISSIEEIDILQKRYNDAVEYMAWIDPALNQLNEDERFVLYEFYMSSTDEQSAARFTIASRYHIDESSSYRKKNRALQHLTVLLYGKS